MEDDDVVVVEVVVAKLFILVKVAAKFLVDELFNPLNDDALLLLWEMNLDAPLMTLPLNIFSLETIKYANAACRCCCD